MAVDADSRTTADEAKRPGFRHESVTRAPARIDHRKFTQSEHLP
jgi:hypothetical protein